MGNPARDIGRVAGSSGRMVATRLLLQTRPGDDLIERVSTYARIIRNVA